MVQSNSSGVTSVWPIGGECGDLLRSIDWSHTSLGLIANWSPALCTAVNIVLRSPMPEVLMWGHDHVMIYNDHYIPIAQARHPRALGGTVASVWPEIWDWTREVLAAGMKGDQRAYRDQLLKLERNGHMEDVWFDLYYTPVADEAGQIGGVLCAAHITTDRVSHRQALRENETLLRIAGEAANFGGWIAYPNRSRLVWSDVVCAIHEVEPGTSPTFEEALEFCAPAWRDRITLAFCACKKDGTSFDEELEIITASGRRKSVRMVGHGVRNELGVVAHLQGAFQDISAQKRTEDLLRESQQRFQQHADAMPFIVWTADHSGMVDYISRAMIEFTGKASAEILGERWTETIHPDDLAGCLSAWEKALAAGKKYECEFRIRRKDGTFRWHAVSAVPVLRRDGAISKWIGAGLDTQDRRLAEDNARGLAQKFSATLESMTDGFCILDREWRFTYLNSEAERLLRRSREELLGKVHWEEFPETLGSPLHEASRRALERGGKSSTEMHYEPFKSWFEINAYPSPEGLAVYFRDITERRNAEQQLRLLETAISKINDIVIITEAEPLDEPGPRVIFVNNAFAERTGYIQDEVVGKSPRFLQGAKTQRQELDRIGAALRKLEPVRAELINYTKNGEEIWLEMDIVPIADAQGALTHFVAVGRDATERKQAQQTLHESEARFRTVAKATADLVWDWNITIDQIWWNDEFLNLYGRMPGQVEPGLATWSERLHPEDKERTLSSIKSAVAGSDEYWSAEYRLIRPDGSIVHLIDSAFIARNENGAATRMVGGIRNVSERVEMESKHRQSQRLETIGELTGGVAHDFNNLLTVILGNAEILEESLSGNQRLRLLAEMTKTAAERGADLTHRLLAFARRQPLAPAAIDVNRLVNGMNELFRRTLIEDIEIEFVSGGGLWEAHVDTPQLETALLNLAINARDAMPAGGRLTIKTANARLDQEYARTEDDVTPGQYVLIAVSDTGTGMNSEVLEHAFQPFYTTKEVGKGSGLGLSMIYGFVKQSGGHIKIYSEVGQGSTVRLYLPRARREPDQADMETAETEPVRGREKILVVEDDELVRSHVSAQLMALGYNVVAVSNGPEALEAIRQIGDIELLFTDVVMPGGLNGRQLAEKVFRLRPELPVLFTSGYAENAIVHHGRLDAGVHLLNKPYRRKDLAAKIRLVLDEADGG